jgi:hypothetical protein
MITSEFADRAEMPKPENDCPWAISVALARTGLKVKGKRNGTVWLYGWRKISPAKL